MSDTTPFNRFRVTLQSHQKYRLNFGRHLTSIRQLSKYLQRLNDLRAPHLNCPLKKKTSLLACSSLTRCNEVKVHNSINIFLDLIT